MTTTMTELTQTARSPEFRQYVTDLLLDICRIDTVPCSNISALGQAEAKVHDILEQHARGYGLKGLRAERKAILPQIASHPFYSNLYYTVTPQTPKGMTVQDAYRGRHNLVFTIDGANPAGKGVNQALNAHIDVVPPYIAPRVEGGTLFGRGSCDDKGSVVTIMAALKLVGQFLKATNKSMAKNLTAMIVIDEETGGNGSLSMACDRDLKKRYDSLMVLECCSSNIYPGNRGALWYKIDATAGGAEINLFEASAFVIEEMEKEGRSIKSESNHPLFPHRPVQTCHGVIGNYGEHPSRINGRVDFDINLGAKPANLAAVRKLVQDVIDSAIAEYIGVYGDKTKALDASGKPKVDHHYDLVDNADGTGFVVQVHGSTGHMGSILINDGAITKMSTMVRALARSRSAISAVAGAKVNFSLHGYAEKQKLIMEGGQGFLPTHDMPQVMRRISDAVRRGAANYLRFMGLAEDAAKGFVTSFDKLHNAAFAGKADSSDMLNAIAAAKQAGIWRDEPVRGWDVSCDSRIFASEYPEMTVLTGGPGALTYAHADNEQVEIEEVCRFAEFLADFILRQTGTI